jgi:hypothetical protein
MFGIRLGDEFVMNIDALSLQVRVRVRVGLRVS